VTHSESLTPEQVDAFLDGLAKGATIGEIAGLSSDALEASYSLAYNLYNTGKYTDAEKLFSALCIYSHNDARFWMGLGGCRQAGNNLEGAIDAYNMATVTGALSDPGPSVQAGLCYMKLNDHENAAALFDAALEFGQAGNVAHQAYRERARAMLDMIRKGA
jgi:type III secretion system low calcium response chaperone LcrH/SycD